MKNFKFEVTSAQLGVHRPCTGVSIQNFFQFCITQRFVSRVDELNIHAAEQRLFRFINEVILIHLLARGHFATHHKLTAALKFASELHLPNMRNRISQNAAIRRCLWLKVT